MSSNSDVTSEYLLSICLESGNDEVSPLGYESMVDDLVGSFERESSVMSQTQMSPKYEKRTIKKETIGDFSFLLFSIWQEYIYWNLHITNQGSITHLQIITKNHMPPYDTWIYNKTPNRLHKVTILSKIDNLNIESRPTTPKANKP